MSANNPLANQKLQKNSIDVGKSAILKRVRKSPLHLVGLNVTRTKAK